MLSVSEFVIVNPNSLVYEFDDLTNTLEQNEISYASDALLVCQRSQHFIIRRNGAGSTL